MRGDSAQRPVSCSHLHRHAVFTPHLVKGPIPSQGRCCGGMSRRVGSQREPAVACAVACAGRRGMAKHEGWSACASTHTRPGMNDTAAAGSKSSAGACAGPRHRCCWLQEQQGSSSMAHRCTWWRTACRPRTTSSAGRTKGETAWDNQSSGHIPQVPGNKQQQPCNRVICDAPTLQPPTCFLVQSRR